MIKRQKRKWKRKMRFMGLRNKLCLCKATYPLWLPTKMISEEEQDGSKN